MLFEAPADAIVELERGLQITEELLRHLVTRVERPVKAAPSRRLRGGWRSSMAPPPPDDEIEDQDEGELIDESESEAAPAAIE